MFIAFAYYCLGMQSQPQAAAFCPSGNYMGSRLQVFGMLPAHSLLFGKSETPQFPLCHGLLLSHMDWKNGKPMASVPNAQALHQMSEKQTELIKNA